MEDPKPSHHEIAGKRRRMRVLVMGDEAADVSAFLRAATNSTDYKRIVTLSTSDAAVGRPSATSYESLRDRYVTSADLDQAIRNSDRVHGKTSEISDDSLLERILKEVPAIPSESGDSGCSFHQIDAPLPQGATPEIEEETTWEVFRSPTTSKMTAADPDSNQVQIAVSESLSSTTSTITAADSDSNQLAVSLSRCLGAPSRPAVTPAYRFGHISVVRTRIREPFGPLASQLDPPRCRLGRSAQKAVCESSISTTSAMNAADFDSEGNQRIAVWESTLSSTATARDDSDSSINHEMVFEFHQLLNVNLFRVGSSSYGKYEEGGSIDPLDVRSGIRAQLNMDFPANANTKEEWDKWWDDHGIHLSVLVLSTKTFIDSPSSLAADNRNGLLLRHFFSRYYGLHSVPHADNQMAACLPAPLRIILGGGMRRSTMLRRRVLMSEIEAAITEVLRPAINDPGPYDCGVIDWPGLEAAEEAAVCGYVKENLLVVGGIHARAASTEVRMDGISRQYHILREIWRTGGIATSSKFFSCPWLHVPPPATVSLGASGYRNLKWMIERSLGLLHPRLHPPKSIPRTLNILSCIWRLPPNLKKALTELMLSDELKD